MPKINQKLTISTYILPINSVVLLPGNIMNLDLKEENLASTIEQAMKNEQLVVLTPYSLEELNLLEDNVIERFGTLCKIRQIQKLPNTHIRITIEGLSRVKILEYETKENIFTVSCDLLEDRISKVSKIKIEATLRVLKEKVEDYSFNSGRIAPDILKNIISQTDYIKLVDYVVTNLALPTEAKIMIMNELNTYKRLQDCIAILITEIEIIKLDRDIHDQLRQHIDDNQRDYYLREQIKIIQAKLGVGETETDEIDRYRDAAADIDYYLLENGVQIEDKIYSEIAKLEKLPPGSHEGGILRGYIETLLELPWGKYSVDNKNLNKAIKILNNDHYGLVKIKEKIIEILAAKIMSPNIKGQIICLVGPPGVGKTSIAKSIARSMNNEFVRISLGGVRDEADIRGHRKTYIGAMPGRIITAIKQAGVSNPLILLDEIDKMGNDFRGDPASALLEILDAEQNYAFKDHYIELPYDLRKVTFITTANSVSNIPAPLLDRMEIIELVSYTSTEKFEIAKRHLLPKQLNEHNLTSKQCKITDTALNQIIEFYTKEAGVRKLEKYIQTLYNKAAKELLTGQAKSVIYKDNLEKYIGVKKYRAEITENEPLVGVVNGLAFTTVGGTMMQLEAAALKGQGKIVLTGSLGNVMKESATTAVSYIRSCAVEYGISEEFYKNYDIHIHATESAIPKDGPSAGVTIATAVVSALTGKKARHDVAMTGEISLRGRVLPIGGLKEKSMAAYKAGVKTVFIPLENEKDLAEIDELVKNSIEFIPVDNIATILAQALEQ